VSLIIPLSLLCYFLAMLVVLGGMIVSEALGWSATGWLVGVVVVLVAQHIRQRLMETFQ